jgi:hypothetical protein
MPEAKVSYESLERYHQNARKAQVADLMGRITGANTDLVSYDEVAKRLRARQHIEMGTQTVPLNLIVGSVGRYRDFTRTFLPRTRVSPERWARIDSIMHSFEGYPPIELYKIGEVYFVRDGNHRVSVARANGLNFIEAYVTELATDVDLTLDDFERDRWIIKVERTEFEQATRLDALRPDNNVEFTEPGRYPILLRHIKVHQYLRNLDLERENAHYRLEWADAVQSWYDNIYLPVIEAIHRYNLMESFPRRTEADLYLWIVFHRERLANLFGLGPLTPDTAVSTFAETHSERPLDQAIKSLRRSMHKAFGDDEIPMGMSEDEFAEARARHEAGERTLLESETAYGAISELDGEPPAVYEYLQNPMG